MTTRKPVFLQADGTLAEMSSADLIPSENIPAGAGSPDGIPNIDFMFYVPSDYASGAGNFVNFSSLGHSVGGTPTFSAGQVVLPCTGYWHVSVNVMSSSDVTFILHTPNQYFNFMAVGGLTASMSMSVVVPMSRSDQLEIGLENLQATTIRGVSTFYKQSFFSAHYLGPI